MFPIAGERPEGFRLDIDAAEHFAAAVHAAPDAPGFSAAGFHEIGAQFHDSDDEAAAQRERELLALAIHPWHRPESDVCRQILARLGDEFFFTGKVSDQFFKRSHRFGMLASRIAPDRKRPTGVVAVNDMLAFGLLAGFRDGGLAVPDDVSVIGMDGLFLSSFTIPGLTTISLPVPAMARTIVERVVGRRADPDSGPA